MNSQVATLPLKSGAEQRMGTILLEQGKLRPEDIERVLRVQKQEGMIFGEAARRLGLVTEGDVQQALARQFDYHFVEEGKGKYPRELVAAYDPFSPQVEMLRAVRTHLMQTWIAQGRRALAIMSAGSGEGASLFAANLAVTFSQLGQRTLLIDANMRRPRQHAIFGLTGRQGLSDILANRAGIETFSSVEGFPHLSLLPAGTVPPNPLELLGRPGFAELQASLATRFDVILIDVPAMAAASDALAVCSHTGGVWLVCRKDRARLGEVRGTTRQLARVGAQVVGSALVEF
ncbi:MAG TPA: chain length determinant protein tyrosine kinase EpsG [Noviherbaspirillum sp.]|nr:chain length determinant protein tyrosine kinase EpsG [Noviherbaspirillum sp.]